MAHLVFALALVLALCMLSIYSLATLYRVSVLLAVLAGCVIVGTAYTLIQRARARERGKLCRETSGSSTRPASE